ncbi:ribose ABC transporter substrate-binding protein [Agathobaculum butyriciproducens]|jgi:ribose transport system substrate-binding protein|nr:ribose ABC transporter substrate-binding protein [Agathobaculum butyriciproducens]RGC58662.1 ribose ABC transporter substrate-binding protein [Agathobaculum butyriciproducens]
MKKRILAALMVCAMGLTMTACGSGSTDAPAQDSGATQTSSGGDYSGTKVAIILKTLSSEYWGYVEAGIRAAEKDLGCTVDLAGPPSETSYDEQQNMIETIKGRSDIQAVAVAPLQPDMAATLLKDMTIPVLAVDTRIKGADNVLSFVGTDHETAAHDGAKQLCESIGSGAKVALIEGVQGDTTNTARFKGFQEGAEEAGAEILDVQYCNAAEDQARTAMDAILSRFPNKGDLDIVFVCNDGCAQAAARALKETGRDDILICGYDGISSGVQSIIDGTMAASVAQDPYNIGYQCVKALCMAANGETIDKEIDTGSRLITKDNAEEYLATLNEYLK